MSHQDNRRVLIFQVGHLRCAAPTDRVHEIAHFAALISPPAQPSILSGFLNLRGEAVPVVRLCKLLGLEFMPCNAYTTLVILHGGGFLTALEVGTVEEVVEIRADQMRELGVGNSWNDFVESAFSWNGHEVCLLSIDQLLLAKEKECLREFQAATQRRLDELRPSAQ
jgi:purine-binding chemotaxis protein CheW